MVDEFALIGKVEDKPMTFTPIPRLREMSRNLEPNSISEKHHYDEMNKLASKYDPEKQEKHQDSMTRIGDMIAIDYPFFSRGTGFNTLAGQLDCMDKANRDCKLPTFMLTLSLSRMYPECDIKIIIDRLAPFHPVIKLQTEDHIIYGEYGITQKDGKTIFRLLRPEEVEALFYKERIVTISPDLEGMQTLDEAFVEEQLIS